MKSATVVIVSVSCRKLLVLGQVVGTRNESRFRQVAMEYLMRAREAVKDGYTPVIRKEASAANISCPVLL